MRGKTKLVSLAAILTIMLAVSMVFASGIVDVSEFRLLSIPPIEDEPLSPGTTVAAEPSKIIKDYINNPGYQIGNKFTMIINVSEATDLYTWQLNLTWTKDKTTGNNVLSVSKYIADDFLGTTKDTSSEALSGIVINFTDNTLRTSGVSETVLGEVAGVSGAGDLITVEFLVVGYGCSKITISTSGNLATKLLSSTGATITFTVTTTSRPDGTYDFYFRNRLVGDATGEGVVDSADISKVIYHRTGPPSGPGGYQRDVDIDDNGVIDSADISLVIANRGRHL